MNQHTKPKNSTYVQSNQENTFAFVQDRHILEVTRSIEHLHYGVIDGFHVWISFASALRILLFMFLLLLSSLSSLRLLVIFQYVSISISSRVSMQVMVHHHCPSPLLFVHMILLIPPHLKHEDIDTQLLWSVIGSCHH